MWPFSSRSSRGNVIAPTPTDLPDFSLYEQSTASLKVWLPQTLVDRINWISRETDASRPDIIRACLFEHIYGRVAMLGLQAYRKRQVEEVARKQYAALVSGELARRKVEIAAAQANEVKFSRQRQTREDLERLGKSDEDITLTMPAQLKKDLAELAKKHGLTPSSYVRKALVLMLLGETVHTEWQRAIGKIGPDVLSLERE